MCIFISPVDSLRISEAEAALSGFREGGVGGALSTSKNKHTEVKEVCR